MKFFTGMHTLKIVNDFLSLNVIEQLRKSLIFPYSNYCDTVINDMTVEPSNKLQHTQRYCLRCIFYLNRINHISQGYKQI